MGLQELDQKKREQEWKITQKLFKYIDEKYPEILKGIRETKVLSPENEELLNKAITQCKAER